MAARFLVRFDDICPTMDWPSWDRIEGILQEVGVAPIVSIVPDNRDPRLAVRPPLPEFWDRARAWRDRGWPIGLHGYQHLYVTREAGIIGLNARSEFAGLPEEEQEAKLRAGLAILRSEGLEPAAWVAPSHSFDCGTVSALRTLGLRVISDGLFLSPRLDAEGMLWVPQQLWRFYPLPFGVWTVCLHPNGWSAAGLEAFRATLLRYRSSIATLDEITRDHDGGPPRPVTTPLSRLLLAAKVAKLRLAGRR